ncbi:hypothetical protein J3R30DRAFT_3303165 [Lentinula aciculospora]|uniref:Uncharacterized protein n=1 Tax=Lentinula aciculospora TaxID=153920 RepID=A0A9W8ZYS5_9AGAR|nr:hypothetical protein J3R30DRAFT_3303165 [Lentinula aciculospora]
MGSTLSTLSSALTKDAESPSYNGNPSEDDVVAVREIMLDFLPLEIIDLILDYGEYWPCLRVDSNSQIDAEASSTITEEATWLYLISPPIPPSEIPRSDSRHRKIRKATFEMESHDQGWTRSPEYKGTYNGSWSWFEAIIYRASASPCWLDLDSGVFNLGATFNASDMRELFPEPNPNRWHVQSNLVAINESRFHSVTWTEYENEAAHVDPISLKGREGLGHELIGSLKPGDRVMLIAKSKHLGSVNHVYGGSIEIYYSV